uniref:Putative UPF0481 protein At3g02645 n=1 Tax=Tanacetum cinerariifolium TaxID=118510 RepID=A0A6L2NYU9_TANCI|nr:putative UPF0481 protein At3g02645 [Tanacetum cinerariifolium]
MEQKKLDVVRKVLQDNGIKDFKIIVLDKVGKLVPVIRSCYDMFLQGDDDSLAWIFTIDGLFLLNLFGSYEHVMDAEEEGFQRFLKSMESPKLISHNIIEEKIELDDLPSLISFQKEKIVVYSVDKSIKIIEESDDFLRQKDFKVISENQIDETEHIIDLPPKSKQHKVGPQRRLLAQDRVMVQDQIPQILLKHSPTRQKKTVKVNPRRRLLAQDIMMVENQISLMVLKEINGALHQSSASQSPTSVDHLLHYS